MKTLISTLTIALLVVGAYNASAQATYSEKQLTKTWYLKKITINGHENAEEYPVSDGDALILKDDHSVSLIDKTLDYTDEGTWSLKSGNTILIDLDGEISTLSIIRLTETTMIQEFKEDIDVVTLYYETK